MSVFTRPKTTKPGQKKRWHYAFCIAGVRYRGTIPEARTQYEAEKVETRIKHEVYEGHYGKPKGETILARFIEEAYLPWSRGNKRSWKHDEFRARVICDWFRGKTFAQVSPLLIEKFKKERRESITARGGRRSSASVNRELELLSRIFNMAIDNGETESNPCRKVKKLRLDNKRTRYLLDEEEPRLLSALTKRLAHLRPLVTVAIGTGMRRGDQLNLRWERVDFQRNVINVPNSKTGRDYTMPMNEDVRNIMLEFRRNAQGSEYVFVNPETGLPYIDLKKGFAAACLTAGIENLHWNDLRHTFGTRLGEAGYSEATIAELMGHTSTQTTRRYTHGTERAKRSAVEAARVGSDAVCHNSATNEKQQPLLIAVNG